jgi:hypothetical protein
MNGTHRQLSINYENALFKVIDEGKMRALQFVGLLHFLHVKIGRLLQVIDEFRVFLARC